MRREYLFHGGGSIFDVVESQKKRVKDAVQKLDPNYLLSASETDLILAVVDEHRLDVPVLQEDEVQIADHGEAPVDVSRDPMRHISDRSRPFYIQGNRTTIAVPFDGDAGFFRIQPQTYGLNPPCAILVDHELHLTYVRLDQNAEAIKTEFTRDIQQIKQSLQSLEESARGFNNQLEPLVRQHVQTRKARLLADQGMVSALGLPIRRRQGAQTTYAVPVQRRFARLERPKAPTGTFAPEPALGGEEYQFILSIIRNMVRVMEQSPHAFEGMGEEDLRTHFLVQLNAQYEGQATGETFNFQGKTDILIRVDGKNVFIAECKFWKGEKEFLKTIDQLLSYLSWRDTKTAVIVFNRNANFTQVLKAIRGAVPKHDCFKAAFDEPDESSFHYRFHQPADKNRELILTVIAFNVPVRTAS
jgi:hypothetical protein